MHNLLLFRLRVFTMKIPGHKLVMYWLACCTFLTVRLKSKNKIVSRSVDHVEKIIGSQKKLMLGRQLESCRYFSALLDYRL